MKTAIITIRRPNGQVETVEKTDDPFVSAADGNIRLQRTVEQATRKAGAGEIVRWALRVEETEADQEAEAYAAWTLAHMDVIEAQERLMDGTPDAGYGRLDRAEKRLAAARSAYLSRYGRDGRSFKAARERREAHEREVAESARRNIWN